MQINRGKLLDAMQRAKLETFTALARQSGVQPGKIHAIAGGMNAKPATAATLARTLRVDVAELTDNQDVGGAV